MTALLPDAARLEHRLLRVFSAVQGDSGVEELLRRRVAMTFLLSSPEVAVRIDGRDGHTARLSTGEAARLAPSDLTFRMSGETAHALWRGDLHPVAAMLGGRLAVQGPLPLALALAPGLEATRAAYRAQLAEEEVAGDA